MSLKSILLAASLVSLASLATGEEGHDHHQGHDHGHKQEQRQHGAHVHGIAALNLALEGDEVHIEFESPAANVVGFEHAPSSKEDHAALSKAVATLKKGDQLFVFNKAAGCSLEKAMVASALLAQHDDHAEKPGGHHDHDDHGHKEHAHGEQHDASKQESHSDVTVVYHFECENPAKLSQLTVELFEAFPATAEIDVQYIIESKQGAKELTPKHHVLKF